MIRTAPDGTLSFWMNAQVLVDGMLVDHPLELSYSARDALVWLRVRDMAHLQRTLDEIRRSQRVTGTRTLIVLDSWSRGGQPSIDWDLWALAVMTFEMIVGDLPFAGAPGTNARLSDLSATLRPVFARAFAIDPLARPTSACEFLGELDRALAVSHV